MKAYKSLFAVGVLAVFIVPQIALAAWWNPLSWSIWDIFKTNTHQEIQVATTTPTTPAPQVKQTKVNTNTGANTKAGVETTPKNNTVKTTDAPASVPANSTLCNGTYYSSCAAGSDLVCPSNGGAAYCQPKAAAQPAAQVEQKHYFLENGSYVLLTDAEHEGIVQQKNATLQQLQDQINTYVAHSQKLLTDSQVGCEDLGSALTFQTGRAAVEAQTHASVCAAQFEYANNMIKLDNMQIQAIQQKMQWINQNYQ